MDSPDPYRDALHSVLPDDLKEEFAKAEERHRQNLAEAVESKARAEQTIRGRKFGRPFEVLEFELEKEHAELVRYHTRKFVQTLRSILEAWKDSPEG